MEIRYKQTIINVDIKGNEHDREVLIAFASMLQCYFGLEKNEKQVYLLNVLVAMEKSLEQIKRMNDK